MKLFTSILLLAAFILLNTGCVSRTTITEKGYGDDQTKQETIWFWQKDFRKPK